MDLSLLNEKLIQEVEQLKDLFHKNTEPKDINDHEYFFQLKKETAQLFSLLDEWENAVLLTLKEKPLKIFEHQITATKDNIEVLVMHSYYKDIRKRLYMERYYSIMLVLENIKKGLNS